MAVLSDQERANVWAGIMDEVSAERGTLGNLTKQELRAAIDAVDQWIEDNSLSFNNALPLPARTELSTKQKARLFMAVARRRFEIG